MPFNHVLLLIFVALIWGVNFIAIKFGLKDIPPLTFSAMRFFIAAFPAVFFVKKPNLPLYKLALLGLFMFAGQFSFLFSAMHVGLSAGLASLVLQIQAFFTIALAVLFLHERPMLFQILGAVVATIGIVFVGCHTGGEVTIPGLCFVIMAALSWAAGNIIIKTFGKVEMFGVVIWGSLFAFFPLAVIAYYVEGGDIMLRSISSINLTACLSLAYIVYLSTFVGYTLWNRMLAQYSAVTVAPFTLLIPVFGLLSATFVLNEPYPFWKFLATMLITAGLCLNQFGAKLQRLFLRSQLRGQP